MCARHDITVGRTLIELEPVQGAEPGTLLLYLTLSDLSDGQCEWKGCVRLSKGPIWEADTYGGSPLLAECHSDEVQSS